MGTESEERGDGMSTINLNMTLCPDYSVEINKHEEIVFTGPLAEILFGTLTSLTDDMLPSTLTSLRSYLCQDNPNLTTVNLMKIIEIGISTFANCGITSVNMPNLQNAGMQSFAYNPMTYVSLPSLLQIGTQMFQSCQNLVSAEFQAATSIYRRAFYNCTNLETLILGSSEVVYWDGTANLYGTKIEAGEGYIYVPATLVNAYKEADGWSDFASQIRSIAELEV